MIFNKIENVFKLVVKRSNTVLKFIASDLCMQQKLYELCFNDGHLKLPSHTRGYLTTLRMPSRHSILESHAFRLLIFCSSC